MSRNAGSAPAGSRVQATQRDGNKTQANPDWDSMAARSVTGELEYIVHANMTMQGTDLEYH